MGWLLDVHPETVANWELGKAKPLARHMAWVIGLLGHDTVQAEASLPGRLRATRRRLGLTQAAASARLGLEEGTVTEFELGRRRASRRDTLAVRRQLSESKGY